MTTPTPSDELQRQARSLAPDWNFLVIDDEGNLIDYGPTGRPARYAFATRAGAMSAAARTGRSDSWVWNVKARYLER